MCASLGEEIAFRDPIVEAVAVFRWNREGGRYEAPRFLNVCSPLRQHGLVLLLPLLFEIGGELVPHGEQRVGRNLFLAGFGLHREEDCELQKSDIYRRRERARAEQKPYDKTEILRCMRLHRTALSHFEMERLKGNVVECSGIKLFLWGRRDEY